MATVVLKLFQIVQPDKAFFGLKDAQQVAVIRRMTEDLNVPVEIVACPTVRESDGLAKSSRNVYLSGEERSQATVLYEALKQAEQTARDDMQVTPRQLKNLVTERIRQAPLANIEYVELVQYPSLQELEEDVPLANQEFGTVLMAVAVRFGTTRLIDNVLVSMKEG